MLTQAFKLVSGDRSFERQIECTVGSIGSLSENDLFEHDYEAQFGGPDALQEDSSSLAPLTTSPRSVLVFGDLHQELNGDLSSPRSGLTGFNSLATSPGSCSPADSPRDLPYVNGSESAKANHSSGAWSFSSGVVSCDSSTDKTPGAAGAMSVPILARSCPRPIIRPAATKTRVKPNDQDEDHLFVPPHQLASMTTDTLQFSSSSKRSATAMMRLRSGVLRKTGYLDGHTETACRNSFRIRAP